MPDFNIKHVDEAFVDLCSLPYTVVNTILYSSILIDLIDSTAKKSDDDWDFTNPYYTMIYIGAAILFIMFFTSFSQTNQKLFDQNFSSRWTKVKNCARKYTGLPGTAIKIGTASVSTYLLSNEVFHSKAGGITVASIVGLASSPSQIALFWDKLKRRQSSNNTPVQVNQTDQESPNENVPLLSPTRTSYDKSFILRFAGAHLLTLIFSVANTSIYFRTSLNLPKRIHLMDHTIGEGNSITENIFYSATIIISLVTLISTYFSYVDLSENVLRVNFDDESKYQHCKRKIKKLTGILASVYKSIIAGGECFSLLYNKGVNMTFNTAFSLISTLSGSITQSSILFANPLKDKGPDQRLEPESAQRAECAQESQTTSIQLNQ